VIKQLGLVWPFLLSAARRRFFLRGPWRAIAFEQGACVTKLLPADCLKVLADEFGLIGQTEIAEFLNLSQPRIAQIKNDNKLTKGHIRKFLRGAFGRGRRLGHKEANTKLLGSFGKLRGLLTQNALASNLKKTQGAVAQWKSGYPISEETLESILRGAAPLTIRRLVELEEIDPGQPGTTKWYFYSAKTNVKRTQLLNKLAQKRGIYVYFDVTGRPTYVGKADKTYLDKEVENRLQQEIKKGRLAYGENMKKNPRLRQGEIVKYISAYEVVPREAISLIEALLIRTTGNVQYNKRLEKIPK
jgi:transcriptional regulator with XRE-family HTH domain